jgi:hypothetical protein
MRAVRAPALILAFGCAWACARRTTSTSPPAPPADAASSPVPDAGDIPNPPSADAATADRAPSKRIPPPPFGEAHRTTIPSLEGEAILSPHLATLRAHFGDRAKGPFLMQRAALAGGRVAVLVSLAPDEGNPIVLVIEHDVLAWVKERPTGGITPPVKGLALTPHPDGGAMLFAFVPSVATVAGRIWADDGGAFADVEVLPIDDCEALTAAYGPGLGWVVVVARRGGARAQLVRETATRAWGTGIDVGLPWHRAAPVALAFDTPSTIVLSQLGSLSKPKEDHLLAFRYDATGRGTWPSPVDLGVVREVPRGAERPEATSAADGQVRVQVAKGILASGAKSVVVDSAGRVP